MQVSNCSTHYEHRTAYCREVPVSNCQPKKVHVPTQELLHRKKCLLPDDGTITTTGFDNYSFSDYAHT
jgi:hypothetical protein